MKTISLILILIAIIQSVLTLVTMIGWLRGTNNIVFPGLGLVVTVPAIIILLLILQIVFVGAAVFIKPSKDISKIVNNQSNISDQSTDIFSGCGNGVLDLSLAEKPDIYNPNKDRALKVCINDDDLEAISLQIFCLSKGRIYDDEENILKRRNDDRNLFEESFPEYPMLGRINYIFEDYIFTPEEVEKLREECLKLKLSAPSSSADLALRKLIYACDEALKNDFYLLFSSD